MLVSVQQLLQPLKTDSMTYALTYFVIFLSSLAGVWAFRRWGTAESLIDHPNERSSHKKPTPSGGGLVIVVVALIALNATTYLTAGNLLIEFTIGALLIACVSLIDDFVHVHPLVRICVHGIAAALVVSGVGVYTKLELPVVGVFDLGWTGYVLTFLWIVWLINAYNFMDGIDGIAALQAVVSGAGLAAVGTFFSLNDVVFSGLVISASALGFLVHNWHPAKIFMGDVGSAFLGYSLAALPLILVGRIGVFDNRVPIIAVALVWLFVFDAVLTLGYRVVRREKVWQPHRKHIYQRLVVAGLPHHVVTLVYGAGAMLSVFSIVLALDYRNYFLRIISITMAANTSALFLMWMYRRTLAARWTKRSLEEVEF